MLVRTVKTIVKTVQILFAAAVIGGVNVSASIVTNTGDSGPGTLRQALLDANANPGSTVSFAIPGSPPFVIAPVSPFPPATQTVIIDGTTQPGFAGTPLIQLNGSGITTNTTDGLLLRAANCVVKGLSITRFSGDGIRIENAVGSVIQGNYLGVTPSGAAAGNGEGGIFLVESRGNLIGGTTSGARNVISGGNLVGIYVIGNNSSQNVIQGNFIGTSVSGTAALSNREDGIVISDATSNLVGGASAAARNIISGNSQSGIYILGAVSGNFVQGNFIGTDVSGQVALSNWVDGITIYGAPGNVIGGSSPGTGNLVSGNGQRGIDIFGAGADGNVIQGNLVGTDGSGGAALPNHFNGLGISGGLSNLIGGIVAGAGNVVSGNTLSGVLVTDTNSVGNLIQGNFIGTSASGMVAVPNGFSGITLSGLASNNIVGGTNTLARNVISGNSDNGILIIDPGATGNLVQGNYIGINAAGTGALGNVLAGVRIESPRNVVGGTVPGSRNIISANGQSGIFLTGTQATGNVLQGNFAGTDASGTAALGNGIGGIGISGAPGNWIGGTNINARNLVSGNKDSGIYILGSTASSNIVQGNFAGTDRFGTNALGNAVDGISVYDSPGNLIGGSVPGAGNLASANSIDGIYLAQSNAVGNVVQGNFVGTAANGTSPLGNATHNILIEDFASNNFIGGSVPGSGNRIGFTVFAGYDGVRIKNGTGNLIRRNSIFSNNGLGIDLAVDGVTANDASDPDEGANRQQNFPVLTNVVGRYITTIKGTLNSMVSRPFTIDFYSSAAPNASGHGEGQLWMGSVNVTTGPGGNAFFTAKFTNVVSAGGYVTATATDAANNTSEFSQAILAAPSGDADGDGLPDDYESAFGFNPSDNRDAAMDSDGDGLTNLQEFRAGTDPLSAGSVLRILSTETAGSDFRLVFSTVEGAVYRVEAAISVGGPWNAIATGIAGTGNPAVVTDYNALSTGNRFYRVRVN